MIKGAEWDDQYHCRSIFATTPYRGLKRRFEEGLEWEDTVYYQERIQDNEKMNVTWNISNNYTTISNEMDATQTMDMVTTLRKGDEDRDVIDISMLLNRL